MFELLTPLLAAVAILAGWWWFAAHVSRPQNMGSFKRTPPFL